MSAAEKPSNPSPTPPESGPDVAVVVPVRDEAANVGPLVAEIAAALRGTESFETVFVDDGSGDGTAGALVDLAAEHPELCTVTHAESCGQSAAIWSGVEAARGALIVTMDGDGQNDPADIADLLARHRAAADPARTMIVGHRVSRRDSFVKRASSRIANAVRSRLLGDSTPDTGCGLKVFPRALFLDLPRFDHMHRFLPALVLRAGGTVESVPVNHRPRQRGVSKYGLWNRLWVGIADLIGVWWLCRRGSRPEIATQRRPDA